MSHLSQLSDVCNNRLTFKYDGQKTTIVSSKLIDDIDKDGQCKVQGKENQSKVKRFVRRL